MENKETHILEGVSGGACSHKKPPACPVCHKDTHVHKWRKMYKCDTCNCLFNNWGTVYLGDPQ